jgi:hypothetical protein
VDTKQRQHDTAMDIFGKKSRLKETFPTQVHTKLFHSIGMYTSPLHSRTFKFTRVINVCFYEQTIAHLIVSYYTVLYLLLLHVLTPTRDSQGALICCLLSYVNVLMQLGGFLKLTHSSFSIVKNLKH